MAVQIFKDGGYIYVEPKSLQNHLAAGWSLVDPVIGEPVHPEVIYPPGLDLESLPLEEAETKVLQMIGIEPPITSAEIPLVPPMDDMGAEVIPEPRKRGGRPKGSKNKVKA